jgi:ABC-type dipeptide/oligopeptide/nickel transport system ATPase component
MKTGRRFWGGLVTMLHPHGPYPLMAIVGRQGSAKSTTARAIQDLVDATIIDGSSDIRNDEDLMIVSQTALVGGIRQLFDP